MADIKIAYAASVTMTCATASLASSSDLTAGYESSPVDNSSNKYLDALVGGKITTGTSPTVDKSIEVWVFAPVNDTPLYPDVLDGTTSTETMTSVNVRNAAMKLACVITTDSTSDRTYWIAPFSVAALFGGILPPRWGLFIVHNTGVALNATGSNHAYYYTPVYATVA